ncbi:MAG: TonB-dependent receptor [Candidatus Omnitrophota bacterium]
MRVKIVDSVLCVFMLALFTMPPMAHSQEDLLDLSLEELLNVVVGASKREEAVEDSPAVVTVITEKEIKDFGANTLFDILQRAPSIQMLSSNFWIQNLASMRGDLDQHLDTRVLLLINGRPVRDGMMGGINFAVYTNFPIDIIERIEVIRGPGSVLYGTNAFDGVINIVTKKIKEDTEFSASTGVGSFSAARETVNMLYDKHNISLNTALMYFDEKGWKFEAKDQTGVSNSINYSEENFGVFGNYSYNFNEGKTDIILNSFYSDYSVSHFGIVPNWTHTGKTIGRKYFNDLELAHKISDDWAVHTNLTMNANPWSTYTNIENNEDFLDWIYETYAQGTLFEKVNLIAGGLVEDRTLTKVESGSSFSDTYFQRNYTGYTQVDYKPFEKLKLITGTQFVKPYRVDGKFIVRVGGIYNFDKKFGTKLLYGEAYRAPYPAEQYMAISSLVGNPNLKPEQIATVDWQLFYTARKVDASITFFRSRYTDIITRTTATPASYSNGGGYEIEGVELEGKVNIADNLYALGSFMYKDEKDNLMYSPDLMVKFGLSYMTDFGLNVGLFNSIFSEPRATSAAVHNPSAHTVDLVDFNMTYKLPVKMDLEWNVYVQNLLDQEYDFVEFNKKTMITTLPQQSGRAIYTKLTVRF